MATRSQSTMFVLLLIVWLPAVSRHRVAGILHTGAAASSTLLPTTPAGDNVYFNIFS